VLGVELGGLTGMMRRVLMMAVGGLRVMPGGLVVAQLMVLGGFTMMPGRVLVMLGCFAVVFRCLLGHSASREGELPSSGATLRATHERTITEV
jgi:hypothetical protein